MANRLQSTNLAGDESGARLVHNDIAAEVASVYGSIRNVSEEDLEPLTPAQQMQAEYLEKIREFEQLESDAVHALQDLADRKQAIEDAKTQFIASVRNFEDAITTSFAFQAMLGIQTAEIARSKRELEQAGHEEVHSKDSALYRTRVEVLETRKEFALETYQREARRAESIVDENSGRERNRKFVWGVTEDGEWAKGDLIMHTNKAFGQFEKITGGKFVLKYGIFGRLSQKVKGLFTKK